MSLYMYPHNVRRSAVLITMRMDETRCIVYPKTHKFLAPRSSNLSIRRSIIALTKIDASIASWVDSALR